MVSVRLTVGEMEKDEWKTKESEHPWARLGFGKCTIFCFAAIGDDFVRIRLLDNTHTIMKSPDEANCGSNGGSGTRGQLGSWRPTAEDSPSHVRDRDTQGKETWEVWPFNGNTNVTMECRCDPLSVRL